MNTQLDRGQMLTQIEALEKMMMGDYEITQLDVMEGVASLKEGVFPEKAQEKAGDEGLADKAGEFTSLYENLAVNGPLDDPIYRDDYVYFSCFGVAPDERKDFITNVQNFYENEEIVASEQKIEQKRLPFEPGRPLESFLAGYGTDEAREEIRRAVGVLRGNEKVMDLVEKGAKYERFYDAASKAMAKEMVRNPGKYKNLYNDTTKLIVFLNDVFSHREILEEEKC